MSREDLFRRAEEYAARNGLVIGRQLGFGVHGIVFSAERQTEGPPSALKVHERGAAYSRERDVYFRLQESAVREIRGCHVPQLLAHDDRLLVIEMSVVARPFVLDFAGACLDQPPDFSDEVMADWQAEKQEQFGPRWAEVQAILRELEGYGVFMVDVNPGNVSFGA
ncbi:MAG TPA: hypothetical protein VFW33_20660 [Gemmataceae bacterium]|nr:hypothetical protein [Gemmataceae bacterium]